MFEQQQVPDRIRRTYRSALKQFLVWCHQQKWYEEQLPPHTTFIDGNRRHKRSARELHTQKKYTDGTGELLQPYRYGLGAVVGDVISETLQKEIAEFHLFRLNSPRQVFQPAFQPSTLEREVAGIRLILGWLHRIQGVPQEDLSLTRLVHPVKLIHASDKTAFEESYEEATERAQESVALAYSYIQWLKAEPKQGGRGLNTQRVELSNLKIFRSIAWFVHYNQIPRNEPLPPREWFEKIPVIQAFDAEIATWQAQVAQKATSQSARSDSVETMSTWAEVLAVVEMLRAECVERLEVERQTRKQRIGLGPVRSLSAIAQSYQRFLLCALMTYVPPQRQHFYRDLLVAPINSSHIQECSGYLITDSGKWYICVLGRNGKFIDSPDYQFIIPNIQYGKDCCFYHYLSRWLNEYTYLDERDELQSKKGLRSTFQPQHPYLFTKRNGKKYENPTDLSHFIRDIFLRITGKLVSPHQVRLLFARDILSKAVVSRKYDKALDNLETAEVISKAAELAVQASVHLNC
ncbi:hypothetical protein H6F88_01160 [Oculatella sp. FACHB-28]|uniref:hypothetical protein n=1 Tax=Oculatella sp. FACHB-28 TaxID=2692845 RepID=UPI001688A31A|nr:hypothetical protein [Oculatella sp. FACHB-28]MBD2054650.1 hypothetical protein [Oculatella sp. FACHB-28]